MWQDATQSMTGPKETIVLEGREISYQVRRSARARSLRLEVRADSGLTIVVPKRSSLRELDSLLHQKRWWILRTLDRVAEVPWDNGRRELEAGDEVLYLGEKRTLVIGEPGRCSSTVEVGAASIAVTPGDGPIIDILRAWFVQQARSLIPLRVEALARGKGLIYNRISIRNQRSRWASCSHRRNLSFNWRLVMAPLEVIDYIVAHEVAHLVQLNHSKRFWAIVQEWCPDYKRHKRWLRENDALLRVW